MQREKACKEILGLNRITKKRILELCKKDKLYQTPELNDVLYLHYQGFDCIECLEDYTELKCLWLESNAISEIQGLHKQTKLKCLFLQSNLIRKIENLEYCKELDTLNLSQNHIRKIENCGFDILPALNTLNLASNYLRDCESLRELENCKNLSVLDLSNNRIDNILVVKTFSLMPELKVLVLQGNPVVSKIPQYRKTLILECKKLTYLDSRPVFPKDRACAEAWKRGGYEAERKENERWNRKERKKMRDSVNATINLRNRNRRLDDQISLIPSSDSEDDANTQNKNVTAAVVDSKACTDSIWSEVRDEKHSEIPLTSDTFDNNPSKKARDDEETIASNISASNNDEEFQPNQEVRMKEKESVQEAYYTYHQKDSQTIKNLEIITAEESFQNQNRSLNISIETDDQDYELPKELEEVKHDHSSVQLETTPDTSVREFKTEEEESVKTDFEELTTNLSHFVNRLEKQEERKDGIKEGGTEGNACESSANEDDHLERPQHKLMIGEHNKILEANRNDVEKMVVEMNTKKVNENIRNNPEEEVLAENNKSLQPNQLNKRCESAIVKELDTESEYTSMDISLLTRKSNEALLSLEKESEALKKLLQRLENKNEDEFKDIKLEVKIEAEDGRSGIQSLNLAKKKSGGKTLLAENSQAKVKESKDPFEYSEEYRRAQKQIVEIIIEEVLQSLDEIFFEQIPYKFPDEFLEACEEDDTHAQNLSEYQAPSKSIKERIQLFNQFLNAIAMSHQTEEKTSSLELYKRNSLSLKKTLAQPSNRKLFNTGELQGCGLQLEKNAKNQYDEVCGMVARVYAKKDRYSDSLELVDNKLMVRNKDIEALNELTPHLQRNSSDSGEDYDTAQSDEEEETLEEYSIARSYKPTAATVRKCNEELVAEALIQHASRSNADSEESDDEFVSLDGYNIPNLHNIDKEFFDKLTLDFSNLTEMEQNHLVQCAQSYEELKPCLAFDKGDTCLTENTLKTLQNNSDFSKEEQLCLKQMILEYEKPKKEEELQKHWGGNISNDKYDKNNSRKEPDTILKPTYFGSPLKRKEGEESFLAELQSEEEKNEVEINIDYESCATVSTQSHFKEESFYISSEQAISKVSANNVDELEVLGSSLQIPAHNDESVHGTTFNAELHV